MSRMNYKEIKCTLNIASVFFARFDSSVCGRHGGTRKPSGREYPACGPGGGDHAVVEAVAAGEPVGAANGLFSVHENCLLVAQLVKTNSRTFKKPHCGRFSF